MSPWPLFGLSLVALLFVDARARAATLPSGGVVTSGAAEISMPGADMLAVTQSSARAIVDWQSFSIGGGGKVRFDNGAGATLNRVTGDAASSIDGLLSASGSVYLINPNGVIVGRSGVVDVGGSFVASTLAPDAAAFMAGGDLVFAGTSDAAVVNFGRIGALGGEVALIAARVDNRGTVAAANGTAGLAAGTEVLLRDATIDGGRFVVAVGGAGTSATNVGAIRAAAAELRANGGNVYALAGSTGGVIRADGVGTHDGRIYLTAGTGAVVAQGEILAHGAGGTSGFVETSGGTVDFSSARIDAGQGGTWLIDPTDLTIDQAAANSIAATLDSGSSVIQATTADGSGGAGDIAVGAGVALAWTTSAALTLTAYRDIAIGAGATLTSSGGGNVTLNADNAGTGTGTVRFAAGSRISTAGLVQILYNPASNPAGSGVNPASYAEVTDYSPFVTGPLRAYMLVNSASDLQNIRNNLSASYAIGRNIDAAETTGWNSGAGFAPIGDNAVQFTGRLEGLGHSVSALAIDRPQSDQVGLFGFLGSTASVGNLALTGAAVRGRDLTGALAGTNLGTIDNVLVEGIVTGAAYVGGLAGYSAGSIVNSVASGNRTGATYVGGAAGYSAGSIGNTRAAGNVVASGDSAGGLVGSNHGGIANSAASGNVTGRSYVGGLAGFNDATIVSGAAGGNVFAQGDYAAGLVGLNAASGTIGNSVAQTGTVAGANNVGGLVGLNVAGGRIADSASAAAVTARGVNGGGLVGYNAGAIGNSLAAGAVGGTTFAGGFVGFSDAGASIRNASASGAVRGGSGVGGFAGYNGGEMIGLLATGIVTATGNNVGGLVGTNAATGTIRNSTGGVDADQSNASPSVSGRDNVGGLVGFNGAGGLIVDDLGFGFTSGENNVGGLVGYNAGAVRTSYSAGRVENTLINLGGLVGYNEASGTVTGSVSVAAARALGGFPDTNNLCRDVFCGANVGGLVGFSAGQVTNSFAGGSAIGYINVGGLVGRVAAGGSVVASSANVPIATGLLVGGLVGRNQGLVSDSAASGAVGSAQIGGAQQVGGLVGYNDAAGRVERSNASGTVGSISIGGGLVGYNEGSVTDSFATGNVTGNPFEGGGSFPQAGGLVGQNYGTIAGSYATGAINGSGGGLVAVNQGVVRDSYATGSVVGGNTAGGLVGRADASSRITNSHATGDVVAGGDAGGLVAVNRGSITGSYATGAATGYTNNDGVQSVGGLVGVNSFGAIDSSHASGKASALEDPRAAVGGLIGANFYGVITNIAASGDATGTRLVGGLIGYSTNGPDQLSLVQNATASGNVQGMTGRGQPSVYVGGLIGLNDSRLINVHATGNVSGEGEVGGLVGRTAAAIVDASATGTVSGSYRVGGLIGYANGRITRSFATGAVNGDNMVGGLVGERPGDVIEQSYATGAVSGQSEVGGLAGVLAFAEVHDAYATGSVTYREAPDLAYAGGLFGKVLGSTFRRSYASGLVSPAIGAAVSGPTVGGIAGYVNSEPSVPTTIIDAVVWDVGTTGQANAIGNMPNSAALPVGGSTGRSAFAQSSYSGFDFAAVWTIVPGESRPYLRDPAQTPPPR